MNYSYKIDEYIMTEIFRKRLILQLFGVKELMNILQ